MHEVKLARQVFQRLVALAAEHKLKRIQKVVLRVNSLESENGEVLSAALKDLSPGTALAGAAVEIIGEGPSGVCAPHSHDHDHEDEPGMGEVIIERIEA
jgi:Zn finger protein HypA/HybF involved in hydrogenase expression